MRIASRASLPSDGVNRADDFLRNRKKRARPEFGKATVVGGHLKGKATLAVENSVL